MFTWDRGGASAKIWLVEGAVTRNIGFNRSELKAISAKVSEHKVDFLEKWHEHFGG